MNKTELQTKCAELLATSPTFEHVLAFAFRMEAKLEKNRHKGDREAWLKNDPWDLVGRIRDEWQEVEETFEVADSKIVCPNAEATANECADIANFAMMVADNVSQPRS